MLTQPSLTINRRLNAPPAKVYAAWTDPEKIVQWFGPAATILGSVKAKMDVRVGGCFRISFNTDDGQYHEVGGTYREVVPDERLVFSWAWHSTPEREPVVTVTLKFTNPTTEEMTDVVIADSLTARLEYVDGSTRSTRPTTFTATPNRAGSTVLRWALDGTLKPGESGRITFQVRIK